MQEIVSKIWHSASARNVGKLLSANIIAQVIGILVYPVLTRIYAPEDFGLLNLFLSIGGILVLFSTLEWYNAIVLPQKEQTAAAIVHLCALSIGALVVVLLLSLPFAEPIAQLFKSPALAQYWWLLPVYVALMGVWNVLNYWYIRCKAYGRISGYQISQSLFSAGYKTGLGFVNTAGGLIYASVLAPLCSLILSVSLSAKKVLKPLCVWDRAECKQAATDYANFPKFSMPRRLLNSVVTQLPVLLLTPLFGNALIGLWGMALLLTFTPINMVTNALYQVFYQYAVERIRKRMSIYRYYKRYLLIVFGGILLLQAVVFVPLPQLIHWFLGEGWDLTGRLIRWTFPWMLFYFLTFSTGFLPDIFGKQKIELYFEILLAVLRVAGLAVGVWMDNFETAVAGYCIGSTIGIIARFIWQMELVRRYERTLTPGSSSKEIS